MTGLIRCSAKTLFAGTGIFGRSNINWRPSRRVLKRRCPGSRSELTVSSNCWTIRRTHFAQSMSRARMRKTEAGRTLQRRGRRRTLALPVPQLLLRQPARKPLAPFGLSSSSGDSRHPRRCHQVRHDIRIRGGSQRRGRTVDSRSGLGPLECLIPVVWQVMM